MKRVRSSSSSNILFRKANESILLKSPYIEGKKNDTYISPSFSSNLFPKNIKTHKHTNSKNNLSFASTRMTLNRSLNNFYNSPLKKKALNQSNDINKRDITIANFRYFRELPIKNYFSSQEKLNLNVVHPYKSPVSKRKELCTSCFNNEIVKNLRDEGENNIKASSSDYFRANEMNNLFYRRSIEDKINRREKLTNEVSSVFGEINVHKEKEELQEKQREYPYFIFDPKKRDHQVERAKMIAEIKEKIQKNYLHKYPKSTKKRNNIVYNEIEGEKNEEIDVLNYNNDNQKEKYRKYRSDLIEQINLNNNKKETNSKNGMNREISLMKEKITKMNEEDHNEKRESELMRKRVLQENIQIHNQKLLKENTEKKLENELIIEQINNTKKLLAFEENRRKYIKEEQKKCVKKSLLKQINENIQKRLLEKEAEKKKEDIYFYSHYEKDLQGCEGCHKKVPFKTLGSLVSGKNK